MCGGFHNIQTDQKFSVLSVLCLFVFFYINADIYQFVRIWLCKSTATTKQKHWSMMQYKKWSFLFCFSSANFYTYTFFSIRGHIFFLSFIFVFLFYFVEGKKLHWQLSWGRSQKKICQWPPLSEEKVLSSKQWYILQDRSFLLQLNALYLLQKAMTDILKINMYTYTTKTTFQQKKMKNFCGKGGENWLVIFSL